jgi:Domain of unknown function (DUF4157)
MSPDAETSVPTLANVLAGDIERLLLRQRVAVGWLELVRPLIDSAQERTAAGERFVRREAVPRLRRPVLQAIPEEPPADETGLADAGERVPPTARDRLRPIVGPQIDEARIHVGARSDALARWHRADAVTVDRDIHFRSGAFAPSSPEGIGLLAHELTHVAERSQPGASWRRASADDRRDEEGRATARERSIVRPSVSSVPGPAYAGPVAAPLARPPAPTPAGGELLRPMRAEVDRPSADAPLPVAAPEPTLAGLRDSLFRDLMAKIRVEFERGC